MLRRSLSSAMANVPGSQVSNFNNFVIGALGLVAFFLLATCHSGPAILPSVSLSSPSAQGGVRGEFHVYSKVLSPRREIFNGTEFVYQVPSNPRAVMFLAHGCNCKASFFWDKHAECATCSGAPEERAFVMKALRKSYAVIAISSREKCWRKDDSRRVKFILESWIDKFNLVELPLLGLGASSGGYFMSSFAKVVKFDAIILMIAEGRFQTIPDSTYPSVLFVHMVKDEVRAERIRKIIPVLRKAGIEADEIQCKEMNITDSFFAKRIPYIDPSMSVQLFELLMRSGCLDNRGYLKVDGRQLELKREMSLGKGGQNLVDSLSLITDHWEHHIREELNVAFSFHEFTSLPSGKIIAWLESHVTMPPNVTEQSLTRSSI